MARLQDLLRGHRLVTVTHALAEIVIFAQSVARAARVSPPRGRHCTLVVNSTESAVNNGVARDLIA
jgi:hypothetical protein